MNETDATAPLFGDYVIRLLTAGPAGVSGPPCDAETRAELARCWGVHGERVAGVWHEHETFLRGAAAARGIRPTWPRNRFFAEAIAAGQKETMR